jgi:folate-dependent phosphoribosylglycinamide formyltransferase PurN
MNGKNRVVILCGNNLHHKQTCASLIFKGVEVVGICICDQTSLNLPFKYLIKSIKRKGFFRVISQVFARLVYNYKNKKKDSILKMEIFREKEIDSILNNWNGLTHYTKSYSDAKTLSWIDELSPDICVVHSPYWVSSAVRDLIKTNIVIGGHPGLTPNYRGAHSSFWAIYNGKPEDVGCSVFWLDDGVDTGDLISQRRVEVDPGDSFITLGWKAMKMESEMQANAILQFDLGTAIPRLRHKSIPENSYYDLPTLKEYLKYTKIQNKVR